MAELIHISSEDANSSEAAFLSYLLSHCGMNKQQRFHLILCTTEAIISLWRSKYFQMWYSETKMYDSLYSHRLILPSVTFGHLLLGLSHSICSLVGNRKTGQKSFFFWRLDLHMWHHMYVSPWWFMVNVNLYDWLQENTKG